MLYQRELEAMKRGRRGRKEGKKEKKWEESRRGV
jgi:hypothetical protein